MQSSVENAKTQVEKYLNKLGVKFTGSDKFVPFSYAKGVYKYHLKDLYVSGLGLGRQEQVVTNFRPKILGTTLKKIATFLMRNDRNFTAELVDDGMYVNIVIFNK
jgi:hypothetical protein